MHRPHRRKPCPSCRQIPIMSHHYYLCIRQNKEWPSTLGFPRDKECSWNLESHMLGVKPEIWMSSLVTFHPICPSAYAYILIIRYVLYWTYFIKATIKVRNDKIRGILTAITLRPSHLYSFVKSHKPTSKGTNHFCNALTMDFLSHVLVHRSNTCGDMVAAI